ncbi:MAG: sulfite exporter TauE/SafE family protein, partial [Methylobacteriaceae bacterium]|nr:sulfite exporter TauE/SafE family protein [Methylobacteriaceae bacterium]
FLKCFFTVFVFIMAMRLLFARESWRLADDLPGTPVLAGIGGVIGFLSSLLGIGGGQFANLVLALYNKPIHNAVATSSGVGSLIAFPGVLGYIVAGWHVAEKFPGVIALQFPLALGYVSLLGFLALSPTSILLAPYGANLSHRLSKRRLEVYFGCFLLLVCARFVYTLL